MDFNVPDNQWVAMWDSAPRFRSHRKQCVRFHDTVDLFTGNESSTSWTHQTIQVDPDHVDSCFHFSSLRADEPLTEEKVSSLDTILTTGQHRHAQHHEPLDEDLAGSPEQALGDSKIVVNSIDGHPADDFEPPPREDDGVAEGPRHPRRGPTHEAPGWQHALWQILQERGPLVSLARS